MDKKILYIINRKDGTPVESTRKWNFDSITREINGTSYATLTTNKAVTNLTDLATALMNRVTVRIKSPKTALQGINYFSGYIVSRDLNLTPETATIQLNVLGQASRLFETVYRNGTTIAMDFTASGDQASDIAQDVIAKMQALDSDWPVTVYSVDNSTDTIKEIFELAYGGEVLNRLLFLAYDSGTTWYWFVDGDNRFYFKKAATTAEHTFTLGRDLLSFSGLSEDLQQAKNEVFVQFGSDDANPPVKRRENAASITLHGHRTLIVNEGSIPAAATATAAEVGDAHLAAKGAGEPIRDIKLIIGDNYVNGIENVRPGQTCKLRNIPQDIQNLLSDNMLITRTVYRIDRLEVTLAVKDPQPENQIQKIQEGLQRSEQRGIATTYS